MTHSISGKGLVKLLTMLPSNTIRSDAILGSRIWFFSSQEKYLNKCVDNDSKCIYVHEHHSVAMDFNLDEWNQSPKMICLLLHHVNHDVCNGQT